jgi:hypothetical protein
MERFAATHPRWEPVCIKVHVRFCAGGDQQCPSIPRQLEKTVEKAISNYEPEGRELESPAAFNVMKALRLYGSSGVYALPRL